MIDYRSFVATFGRLLLASLFLWSGLGKVMNYDMTMSYIASADMPIPPVLAYYSAIAVELGASTLLILGFQTRVIALVMAGFALVTALSFHTNFADMNQMTHFFKNISIMGGLLQIVAYGGGKWSLDAWLQNR